VPELAWSTRHEAGVTLVELTVENDASGPRAVRVESAVPALPPRRRGVPESGWTTDGDRDAVELTLTAGERRGVGYASTEAADPPAEIVAVDVPDEGPSVDPAADVPSVEPTVDGVVRNLPSPAPPRDAVPAADGGVSTDASAGVAHAGDATEGDGGTSHDGGRRDAPVAEGSSATEAPSDVPAGELPPAVASWLADVGARVERAEALADADSVPEAASAVADAGGMDAVEERGSTVEADAARLRCVADRARALADRAVDADVPVGTLRRLS
jgi:hypothetical protein